MGGVLPGSLGSPLLSCNFPLWGPFLIAPSSSFVHRLRLESGAAQIPQRKQCQHRLFLYLHNLADSPNLPNIKLSLLGF